MNNLSDRLLKVRKKTGLSQSEFCAKLEISEKTYKNYANEKTGISSSVLKKISNKFAVDVRWLLLGKGSIDEQTQTEILKAVVLITRTKIIEKDLSVPPEKEAQIVRFLVGIAEDNGGIENIAMDSFWNVICCFYEKPVKEA